MQCQKQVQKYKNSIRKRQRGQHLQKLRSKYYFNIPNIAKQNAAEQWYKYRKQPTSNIPIEILKYFNVIQIRSERELQEIINTKLDVENLVNILFVTKCLFEYSLYTQQFFLKTLDKINREKDDQENDKINIQKFEEIRLENVTNYKCTEQIYISYFFQYLKNLPREQKCEIQMIGDIQRYFISYWNKNIDDKNVNYDLSAQITLRLFPFKEVIPNLKPQIKGILSVLIHDSRNPESYQLVKTAMKLCEQIKYFLVFQPSLASFIYAGINNQSTCSSALAVLQCIMNNQKYQGAFNIDYLKIMKQMHRQYMDTDFPKVKQNILIVFYNFSNLDDKHVEQFFLKLDYDEILSNISPCNLYDLLDLCMNVLEKFGTESLFEKIMLGKEMKLIYLISDYVYINSCEKAWDLAGRLLQTLDCLMQSQISIFQIVCDVQMLMKRLQNQRWNQKKQEKEALLTEYDKFLVKIKESETKNSTKLKI